MAKFQGITEKRDHTAATAGTPRPVTGRSGGRGNTSGVGRDMSGRGKEEQSPGNCNKKPGVNSFTFVFLSINLHLPVLKIL